MLHLTVLFSPGPRETLEWLLQLPAGSTVGDALTASPLASLFPSFDVQAAGVGIWGRKVALAHTLRDRDRIEVYRPLKVDPKAARRERFRRQGSRAAGLFARKP